MLGRAAGGRRRVAGATAFAVASVSAGTCFRGTTKCEETPTWMYAVGGLAATGAAVVGFEAYRRKAQSKDHGAATDGPQSSSGCPIRGKTGPSNDKPVKEVPIASWLDLVHDNAASDSAAALCLAHTLFRMRCAFLRSLPGGIRLPCHEEEGSAGAGRKPLPCNEERRQGIHRMRSTVD